MKNPVYTGNTNLDRCTDTPPWHFLFRQFREEPLILEVSNPLQLKFTPRGQTDIHIYRHTDMATYRLNWPRSQVSEKYI